MKPAIYYDTVDTPVGKMHAGITQDGIAMMEFPVEERIVLHKKKFTEIYEEVFVPPLDVMTQLHEQLNAYFEGALTTFSIPLDFVGTAFQCEVWKALTQIPYGKTMSYLELADSIGNREGVRAVAQANGQNRIPILVPCHRIIGSDGKLTGYSGGIWRKEILLSKENGQGRLIF